MTEVSDLTNCGCIRPSRLFYSSVYCAVAWFVNCRSGPLHFDRTATLAEKEPRPTLKRFMRKITYDHLILHATLLFTHRVIYPVGAFEHCPRSWRRIGQAPQTSDRLLRLRFVHAFPHCYNFLCSFYVWKVSSPLPLVCLHHSHAERHSPIVD